MSKKKLNTTETKILPLEKKILISDKEYNSLVDFITASRLLPDEVAECVIKERKMKLIVNLKGKWIYPSKLKELKTIIEYQYNRSLIDAAKMVGAQSATSIGERQTQTTLNAFHSAGTNKIELTTGLPRLEEVFAVARNIKTPSMNVYFNFPHDQITNFDFMRNTLLNKFEYRTTYQLLIDYDYQYNRILTDTEEQWYESHRVFYGDEYQECQWSIRLIFNPKFLYLYKKTLHQIGTIINDRYGDAFPVSGPDHTGILDLYIKTSEIGDVNDIIESIIAIKRKSKKEMAHNKKGVIYVKEIEKKKKTKHDSESDSESDNEEEKKNETFLITEENKEKFFIKDLVLPSILYLGLIGIEGIQQIYFQEEPNGEWYINTKGSNFKKVLTMECVDSKRTTSNNIWDIFDVCGIEGVKSFLTKEFYSNINISGRHIQLLIDSMTYAGKMRQVNRNGIDVKSSGIMAKIAFEQPFDNFFHAATFHEHERAHSISSTITLGLLAHSGTGSVKLIDKQGEELDEDRMNDEFFEKLQQENQQEEKDQLNDKNGMFSRVINPSKFLGRSMLRHGSNDPMQSKEIKFLGLGGTINSSIFRRGSVTEKRQFTNPLSKIAEDKISALNSLTDLMIENNETNDNMKGVY